VAVVRILDVIKAFLGQRVSNVADVLREPWPDAETKFARHDEATNNRQFWEWAVVPIEFQRSRQNPVEELIIAREQRS
jgi:hypothetical protein